MARVKTSKINFERRGDRNKPTKIYLSMNHFIPNVKRNEDLYSFITMMDCTIKKLSIFVATMKDIESFSLELYFYNGSDLIRKTYEIKQGKNVFENDTTVINSGEVVRLDIAGIDSVYTNISGVTIGILLADKVSK